VCYKQILEEYTMKKIAIAAALAVTASTAYAGNMEAPIMEAPIIVEEAKATSSSSAILVPLMVLALVLAAANT
jgi:hypothetical protein